MDQEELRVDDSSFMAILEVCAGSLQSAITAQEAGASRVELCTQLEVGGLTPSYGVIKAAAALKIPVHILIRPRTGGFIYSVDEMRVIEDDVEIVGQLGCAGVVVGVLTPQGVDVEALTRLVQLARRWKMSVTFHRAFDDLQNVEKGLEDVISAGCDRILTGVRIRALIEQARGRIIIMPGGGITPENVASFVADGASEVHASCKKVVKSEESIFAADRWETDRAIVEKMLRVLRT